MKTVLLGFAVAVLLGGIVWAQGDQPGQQLSSFQLMTGTALVITPDGRVTRRADVPPDMLGELTKDAQPMTAGRILFMRDNKLYSAPDRRMQGGTMLSEALARSPNR
ncbi:MAG: hypothetical protein JOY71_27500 [Acetobacteraceae bacterium]|nr:hypothetical protein [Acetobacteraceae bacterium]MBV8525815.1 hypothetical protein [Acetobacteraceae bacterium]MBV8588784.1 hypothetical protein [Acetobacteraceae bacterium]